MTNLTAKRGRVPVKVSYQPIIRWDGFIPRLGNRTPDVVWCIECVAVLHSDRKVWAVTSQELPRDQAPDVCPVCRYRFPKVE